MIAAVAVGERSDSSKVAGGIEGRAWACSAFPFPGEVGHVAVYRHRMLVASIPIRSSYYYGIPLGPGEYQVTNDPPIAPDHIAPRPVTVRDHEWVWLDLASMCM